MSWAWSQLQKSGPAKTGPAGPLATALSLLDFQSLLLGLCGENTSVSNSEGHEVSDHLHYEAPFASSRTHIPDKAHQPVKQQQAVCSLGHTKFPWLHYQKGDQVYCFHCLVSDRRHYHVSLNKEDAFIKNGFQIGKKHWKNF